MTVRIIPIVPRFKEVNGLKVQDGDEVMQAVEHYHNYDTAKVGDKFNERNYGKPVVGVWEDPVTFSAVFEIINQSQGNVWVIDQITNRGYTILPSDFIHIAQNTIIDNGKFSGQFEFVKRQKRIGIRLV